MSEFDPEVLLDSDAPEGSLEEGNPIVTPAGEEGVIDRIESDPSDLENRIVFVKIIEEDGGNRIEEFPESVLLAA